MTATRVWISTFLLMVGLAIAPVAGAALADGAFAVQNDDGDTTEESTMGEEVSTFMQASSADASEGIEHGMFEAAYENADEDERETLLRDRTEAFASKYERLAATQEELEERRDEMNPMAYRARMTRLVVQLSALESSVNETEPRAKAAGIDTDRLDEIRENARNLSGPEVAEIATGLAGIDPPGHQNESPGHADGAAGRSDNASERNVTAPGKDGERGSSSAPPGQGDGQGNSDGGSGQNAGQSGQDE